MTALAHNRPNLCCKIMRFRPTGKRHGELMQSANRFSGAAQPLSGVRVKSPRVFGKGHAAKSRVKDHRIISHVG